MNIRKTIIKTFVAITLVAVIAPVSANALTIAELQAQINALMAQLATLQGQTTTPPASGSGAPAVCAGVTFTRNITVGATGSDVKCLQAVLNQSSSTQVATTGAGSPGNETSYFGPLTLVAVRKFQAENGMTPANQVGPMTRARLNQILSSGPIDPGLPPVLPPTGSATVMLASNNPAAGTVIAGQGLTTLTRFQVNGVGTITGVTLRRIGVSADSTLSNVYLFDGSTRLTDSASVSGGSTITFSGLSIPVSGSKTIDARATIYGSAAAGELVGLQVTGVTLASGTVSGLPVSGNLFTVSTATLASVGVSEALPSSATTTDPENDVRVWESTFNVGNRDVNFTRLALRQINSINSADIKNFRLFIDGTQVATAELDANKYVTFNFSRTLTTGNRNVKVLADIIGGSSFYIQMSLREAADVELVDSQYGVNITPTGVAATTNTIQVNSGTLTVEKATDSPSGNVVDGAADVVLARYNFKATGEPIKVETLLVDFAHVTSVDGEETSTLRNGRIMVNGSQVGSTTTLNPSGSGTSFSTNFIVNPGSPAVVEVRADMFDNDGTNVISNGDKITVTLSQGVSNAERRISYGRINVPSGNVSANQVTVAQGTLSLGTQSNYTNQTTVVPQTNYKLAAYNLLGNSTEEVNVHTISVDFTSVSGSEFTFADLSNVYVKYGSSTTTTKATVSATSNTWSINNLTLPVSGTVPVEIYANIGSSISSTHSIKATTTITGLTASSGQSVNTGAQDGQTIAAAVGSLTGTKAASSADSQIVADNTTIAGAAHEFTAINDTYRITRLTYTISNSTAVQQVRLMRGTETIATAPGAGTVVFNFPTGTGPLVGTSPVVLTVNLELGTVGTGAGTSGSNILVTLGADSRAIANSTGVEAAMTIGTGAGNAIYVYAAVPTITNVALPTSVLSAGTTTLSKFQISTSGTGTIGWKDIIFNVSKTGGAGKAAITSPTIWNADSNTQIDTCTLTSGGAETDTAAVITCTVTTEQQIDGARSYALKATITGTPATNDVISTSIGQTKSYVVPAAYSTVNGTTAEFVWTDRSAQGHSTSTLDWNNGFLVKNLPTDSQTLTK